MVKYILIISIFYNLTVTAQVTCTATGDAGSGYTAITNAELGIENPDCEHTTFGAHITQAYDVELDRNVFVFHSHIIEDNDRCLVDDRVRMEIKGGPGTSLELQHPQNSTSYYRWKFRVSDNFVGASTFNHIFQNKAKGGNDDSFPVLTITLRADRIELRHNGGDTGTDLGILAQADISLFRGRWIEAYMMQTHSESGQLEVTLKDMVTGNTLLEYSNSDIDLWRQAADYNRPKWGIYRSKNSILKDEKFRFADFCISEVDSMLCPSEAVLITDTIAPSAPTELIATQVSLRSVGLRWNISTDAFGVDEYQIVQDGVTVQTTSDTSIVIDNLLPGTTYLYNVQAIDAAGNVSLPSNTISVTTDDPDVLPTAPANPIPVDNATNINPVTTLRWTADENTDRYNVYLGTDINPPLVSTESTNRYQADLAPSTIYYWRVVGINDNGETSSEQWSFTTSVDNPDAPWQVYRANMRPEVETNFFELNAAPSSPAVDEIIADNNGSTNTFYGFRSNTNENFRWRHDYMPDDSIITIVVRLRAVDPDVNGICYFEIRANGWRQKIRINQSTIKLEKTNPVIEANLPFDLTKDMHLIRIVSTGVSTDLYLDENPIPFTSGISDTPSSNTYFEWGNSGGADYGSIIDWLSIDKSGGYSPGEGTALPSDLFLSSIATLSRIDVDGVPLNGFFPSIYNYDVETISTDVPQLSWLTSSTLATADSSNPTSVPNTAATINVIAQDGYTENIYTINYIGVSETEQENLEQLVKIYPNPALQELTIILEDDNKGIVTIHTTDGRLLMQKNDVQGETKIDISTIISGLYSLSVTLDNGKTINSLLKIK